MSSCKELCKKPKYNFSDFNKTIYLLNRDFTPNLLSQDTDILQTTPISAKAKIETKIITRQSNGSIINDLTVQNIRDTLYLFTIRYRSDFKNFLYIKYQTELYRINSSTNIDLTNLYIIFNASLEGSNQVQRNYLEY